MIFLRAAQREFAQTAAAVFVALFAIMLTTQLIRLLGQAARGATASEAVAALLGFASLNYLPVLLSLTLFVAILLTLSRAYRDSEMSIWFSTGVPLTAWIRPVLRFAVPVVLVIAILALFLTPWAMTKRAEYQKRMDHRDDVARITPGAFNESANGERVFFVETAPDLNSQDEHVKNVFIHSTQHNRPGVMVASSGYTEMAENGDKFIVLVNGRRYEGEAGASQYRIMEFERYAVRMDTKEILGLDISAKNLATVELIRDPTRLNLGELLWRIGMPVSALLLSLLAIPLSFVNPRAGRANNLLLAVLTFMIYNNLLSVSQAWVAQGRIPFAMGVWVVHVLMLAALGLMFWRRMTLRPLFGKVLQRWR